MLPDRSFWAGRRILLSGHTGFKGAWATVWLRALGAEVVGLALAPDAEPNLWSKLSAELSIEEYFVDIRDRDEVAGVVKQVKPQIVLHMAAQALVRHSYAVPIETYATNLMGTVHLLDALRAVTELEAALMVTTDKVYLNKDQGRDFTEDDPLGGHDPYSASKAAAEIATASYATSFFPPGAAAIATARAGNVIGGGDWSLDRLVPDVWRAVERGGTISLRNPDSTRPWQHVLEPLAGYFLYLESLAQGKPVPRALNFGPGIGETVTVARVVEILAGALNTQTTWEKDDRPTPPEMKLLSLDPALATQTLGWRPKLSCESAIEWSAAWYRDHANGANALDLCEAQIVQYESTP